MNNVFPSFALFFISSVPNPSNLTAVSYYIEDANIFTIDLETTVTVNIDLSEYSLTTDESILPWVTNSFISGLTNINSPTIQSFSKKNDMFAEINIRKSS